MSNKRALLSVSDKAGIVELGRRLAAAGFELVSTGGTAGRLRAAGLKVLDVSDLTGFPEMMDGRVKTLHPAVHGALLARRDKPDHMQAMHEHGIAPIDVVVVTLYPFQQTIAKPGVALEEAIEQIDIGGPSMLRSAAKNHASVLVVCDPADYDEAATALESPDGPPPSMRQRYAAKVFSHTAAYDAAIADHLAKATDGEDADDAGFPAVWTLSFPRAQSLRYGENPHQRAAFYRNPATKETSLATARQLQGKQLSYNNIMDAEGALEMVRDFADLAPAAAVIVKHSNPCGIALGSTVAKAHERARETDPDSAFGGIVALSRELDAETATAIASSFNEVVIAPSISHEAREILAPKKNLRVLETGPFTIKEPEWQLRSVVGGLLVTDRDLGTRRVEDLNLVTDVTPHEDDLKGMLFAWRCVKWVKSNAIVYANRQQTLGIGAGQMSRVDAARVGGIKARQSLRGAFMASDAFFPFRDNVDEAAKLGIRGIIQPGGSVRDEEVIAAANEHGIVLVFTGMRHFRH
jgi:phosphoribosylaminoimidazolecarboxamide formyltransferase/IMP cyclohydrolase